MIFTFIPTNDFHSQILERLKDLIFYFVLSDNSLKNRNKNIADHVCVFSNELENHFSKIFLEKDLNIQELCVLAESKKATLTTCEIKLLKIKNWNKF